MSTLVYLCHFGQKTHGDLMVAAVTALRNVGNYQGDIIIYSDDGNRAVDLIRRMPGHERIGLMTNSGNRGLFTRYSAAYFLSDKYGQFYDNFMYLDNDVIVSADINPFIEKVEHAKEEFFCCTDEYYSYYSLSKNKPFNPLTVAYPPNYYGRLLIADPAVFTFKPTEANTTMFKSIREIRDTVAEYRYNLKYDTALYSYSLFKRLKEIDYTTIKPLMNFKYNNSRRNQPLSDGQIFTQFTGFKEIEVKYHAIREFIDTLQVTETGDGE